MWCVSHLYICCVISYAYLPGDVSHISCVFFTYSLTLSLTLFLLTYSLVKPSYIFLYIAYYSKARGDTKVPVMFTSPKQVSTDLSHFKESILLGG